MLASLHALIIEVVKADLIPEQGSLLKYYYNYILNRIVISLEKKMKGTRNIERKKEEARVTQRRERKRNTERRKMKM